MTELEFTKEWIKACHYQIEAGQLTEEEYALLLLERVKSLANQSL